MYTQFVKLTGHWTDIILLLSATLTISLTICGAQPAFSQGALRDKAARFDFAPNYYRVERANPPLPAALNGGLGKNGVVPEGGASVLGISPKLLEKPRIMQTQTNVTASFAKPSVNTQPPTAFGKPAGAGAPQSPAVAHAALGSFGKPSTSPGAQPSSAPRAKPASLSSSRQVHGKLLHHQMHYKVPQGLAATPGELAGYGKGFGYVPGPMVQTPEPGFSASKDVYGKLLRHK